MTLFYDPKDSDDLREIENVLKRGGIGYTLREEPEKGLAPFQVHVAEEDIPRAEDLLMKKERAGH